MVCKYVIGVAFSLISGYSNFCASPGICFKSTTCRHLRQSLLTGWPKPRKLGQQEWSSHGTCLSRPRQTHAERLHRKF